jgi:hypothetical protein
MNEKLWLKEKLGVKFPSPLGELPFSQRRKGLSCSFLWEKEKKLFWGTISFWEQVLEESKGGINFVQIKCTLYH